MGPPADPASHNLLAASSAGILMYRGPSQSLEVLLVHPGGPFWRNKDNGAWSIPKGEIDADEDPEDVARREFTEELGSAPTGPLRSPAIRFFEMHSTSSAAA
jgi:predicted NUDIX family NTP pyrophosphohydrolase